MNNSLKVSLVQAHLQWHDPMANFKHIDLILKDCMDSDLIVLPEMWSSGFTMKAHEYYKQTDEAIDLMKQWSQECQALIVGSLITKVGENYYNRLYAILENEISATYDKKHLFAFSGEDRYYTSGNERKIIEYKSWRICLNICYDLRFPVWCRNDNDYDVLLFTANWPNKRIDAWRSLLKARAIENQSYVIGCNCFGTDAWKNDYSGFSGFYDYSGKKLLELSDKSGVLTEEFSQESLSDFRGNFPFLGDRDAFVIAQ